MSVIIGSARGDENGKAYGGKAGDQNKLEVSTQTWYNHSKGWRVLRAKNPQLAYYIAEAMSAACANNKIGYDQKQNQTLWNTVKSLGYDPTQVTSNTETDCARLVRVCVQYACVKIGLNITVPDFYTATLISKLLSTGLFVELVDSKYTKQEDYLGTGDILCTKVKGHTVVVLTNGTKYEGDSIELVEKVFKLGERTLEKGLEGEDVKELQTFLINYHFLNDKADGKFGAKTEQAVKDFQIKYNLDADGKYGKKSHSKMTKIIEEEKFLLVNKSAYLHAADSFNSSILFTIDKNSSFNFVLDLNNQPIVSKNGWYAISYNDKIGWLYKDELMEENIYE